MQIQLQIHFFHLVVADYHQPVFNLVMELFLQTITIIIFINKKVDLFNNKFINN